MSADHAETIADMLHKCMKGWGTDEDGVYTALRQVETQGMWDEVQRQFKLRHADMQKGDLKKALCDELTGKEEQRAKAALGENGVTWDSPAPQSAQSPSQAPPPAQIATPPPKQAASPAPSKSGSIIDDEQAIFQSRMGLTLDEHRRACQDDLDDFVKRCQAISEGTPPRNRYSSSNYSTPAQSPGYASTQPAASPGSSVPARVDTEHAETIATLLHKCMKGWGTDEDGLYKALSQVASQALWMEVQRQFKLRHADMSNGDLKKSILSELTSSEEQRAKKTLQDNGVTW